MTWTCLLLVFPSGGGGLEPPAFVLILTRYGAGALDLDPKRPFGESGSAGNPR